MAGFAGGGCGGSDSNAAPASSANPTPTPAPTPSATPAPTSAPTPAPTPTPTPAPTPAPSPSPGGNVIQADPSNYLGKLAALKPGDTLLLAPGNYGVDAQGADTSSPPGLPIFNLNGTANAPIVITGPETGPRPILFGRNTHNTIRLSNASHIVVRKLEVDGRGRDGFGVATQGPTHHITIEENYFHGLGGDQGIVGISTTGYPTWNWIIRRNRIVGAGTGMYLGNSTGDSPFVNGLIENNLVVDSIGYCIQVKHQVVWASVPAGMPTGKTTTIIRNNVFAKSAATSSTGGNARPNLLVGDCPPSGPGSTNGFAIYGNFFHRNPTESLFQGEGNVAFYDNVMVADDAAVRVQTHNGSVRDVSIFNNTVLSSGGSTAIAVSGGFSGTTQRVVGNAVFAAGTAISVSGATASASQNATDSISNAGAYLVNPTGALGAMDLFPKTGSAVKQSGSPLVTTGLDGFPDWNRDFNGNARDLAFRGAYSGEGTNPGWRLALDFKA